MSADMSKSSRDHLGRFLEELIRDEATPKDVKEKAKAILDFVTQRKNEAIRRS